MEGGGRPGAKGAGGVREAGEVGGGGTGLQRCRKAGGKEEKYATLRNIPQSKKMERGSKQKREA